MSATDELVLFAELGVAFAGFIAIFLIFARREGRFSPTDSRGGVPEPTTG